METSVFGITKAWYVCIHAFGILSMLIVSQIGVTMYEYSFWRVLGKLSKARKMSDETMSHFDDADDDAGHPRILRPRK